MCEPISIGIAIGAAVGAAGAAVTGGDPLMGALMGGVTGGVTGGMGGLGAGSFSSTVGGNLGFSTSTSFINAIGSSVTQAGVAGFTAMSAGGGLLMGMLSPQQQDYNRSATALPWGPQAYNTQHTKVTGSGGRQAAAVLASEIKQAKSLRKRQAEVADYGLGMDMAGTGLQIA